MKSGHQRAVFVLRAPENFSYVPKQHKLFLIVYFTFFQTRHLLPCVQKYLGDITEMSLKSWSTADWIRGRQSGRKSTMWPDFIFFFVFPCAHSLSAVGFSIKETWSELFHLAVCKATKLGGKTAASKNSMPFATPLLFSSLLSLLPNLHITKKLKQSARAFSISCGISL